MTTEYVLDFNSSVKLIKWHEFLCFQDNQPISKPGVYCLLNQVTGEKYIGISLDLVARLRNHSNGNKESKCPKLFRAFNKFGRNNFVVIPLFYSVVDDPAMLCLIETILIKQFDTIKSGYNIVEKNNGVLQSKFMKDYFEKFPEKRQKVSEHFKNFYSDPFNKLLVLLKREPARIAAMKALWADPEKAKRIVELSHTPEANEKRAISAKESWQNPDLRKQQSDNHKAYFAIEENRQKRIQEMQQSNVAAIGSAAAKEVVKGGIWINNGQQQTRLPKGKEIPEGWQQGRLTVWITDGVINKHHKKTEKLPEGFHYGRSFQSEIPYKQKLNELTLENL